MKKKIPIKEFDPNGKDLHELGAKADSGKIRVSLLFNDFPRALLAVARLATIGAKKYSSGGWQYVENGIERYDDAKDRHLLFGAINPVDIDTGELHLVCEAWNCLAKLELTLRKMEKGDSLND